MPSSQVCLLVYLLELNGESIASLGLKFDDEKYTNWHSYRDLTVPTSRCINKQAFSIGNGVMNIVSKF